MIKGGEDFFKDSSDDFSKGGQRPSFSAEPSERIPMIEKIFKEVLGRKPSTRELSFYKYGLMKESEIRLKLLRSDEHKELIVDARKLPNIENDLKNSRASERKLNQKIEDLGLEIVERENLLNEKNQIIQDLREELKNPYDLPNQLQRYEEGFDTYHTVRDRRVENVERKSIKETIREILDILLK